MHGFHLKIISYHNYPQNFWLFKIESNYIFIATILINLFCPYRHNYPKIFWLFKCIYLSFNVTGIFAVTFPDLALKANTKDYSLEVVINTGVLSVLSLSLEKQSFLVLVYIYYICIGMDFRYWFCRLYFICDCVWGSQWSSMWLCHDPWKSPNYTTIHIIRQNTCAPYYDTQTLYHKRSLLTKLGVYILLIWTLMLADF